MKNGLLGIFMALVSWNAFAVEMREVSLWKGYRQSEQDANLKVCNQIRKFGQLCITTMWIHQGAAYDVALME